MMLSGCVQNGPLFDSLMERNTPKYLVLERDAQYLERH